MSNDDSHFLIPKSIDRLLAALSKVFSQEGKRELQEIIVNSQIRIHEGWSSDNWNGGTYGHTLYLTIPEILFLKVVSKKDVIRNEIKVGLNGIHNVQNEFIEDVFLEMKISENHDWRKESGLLVSGLRAIPDDAIGRIWKDDGFRVFLSHKSAVKKETSELSEKLRPFGISCFVAHEDITPTKAWQDEIENALRSMDGFVALLTSDFHESEWTDQEVGYAYARGVPIIAVQLGRVPYGFIGKFQGLPSNWQKAHDDIAGILIKNERILDVYIRRLRDCPNWDTGNTLAKVLSHIDSLQANIIDELISIYNESSSEIRGSYGFNGTKPYQHGPGLVHHLNRIGPRKYRKSSYGQIELDM